jgi:hypothetical protein
LIFNRLPPPPASVSTGSFYGKNPFFTLKNVNAFHRSPLPDCNRRKRREWNLPFLLLTAMFVWFSTSTSSAQIIATFDIVDAICENGKGTITCVSITGGTAPYSCVINCGSCVNVGTVWFNVEPGDYIATITDFTGLQAFATVNVGHDFPEPITLSVTTNPSACNGSTGSACAVATGGTGSFTYEWVSQAQPNVILSSTNCLNNVPASIYELTVDDSNSPCSKVFPVEIQQSSLTLTSTVTNTQCAGADCQGNVLCTGSMTLVPAGTAPYTIVWSDGFVGNGLARAGMCPGTYTATVTDANGCSAFVTNTIGLANAQVQWNNTYTATALNPALPPVAGFPASQSVHFITSNVTWNPGFFNGLNTINTACHIVVAAGAQLTINDLVVRMPQGSTIRVLALGRLIANNSTFEPGCGTTWRGFEVLGGGATNVAQRGNLELIGCTITRATLGISNEAYPAPNAGGIDLHAQNAAVQSQWAAGGGRVRAENTLFLNNLVDARLANQALDGLNSNTGEFVNCLFQLTLLPPVCDNAVYKWWLPEFGRIALGRSQFVLFNNCRFVNENNLYFSLNPTNGQPSALVGIRSLSSGIRITGDPADEANDYVSSFQGFRNGIMLMQDYSPGFTVPFAGPSNRIEHTLFRCFTAISGASLGSRIHISRNWSEDLPDPFSHVPSNSILFREHMRLFNSTVSTNFRYEISNNVFIDDQNEFPAVGCRIVNGGPQDNYIVANYFQGFAGTAANPNTNGGFANAISYVGANRVGTQGAGAHFECNFFRDNWWDVVVLANNSAWSLTGPASIQRATFLSGPGTIPTSAGNSFVNSLNAITNPNSAVPGDMDDMRYPTEPDAAPFYGNGINQYLFNQLDLNTNLVSEMTPFRSMPTPAFPNNCEYRIIDIETLGLQELNSLSEQWSVKFTDYMELVDDGNTSALVDEISTLAAAGSWAVYTALIEKTEVLSDKVLISLVHQLNFPTVLLIDLLATIPGASANERLHEELLASGRVLAEADWVAIKNALPTNTEKLSLERDMTVAKLNYNLAVLRMTNEYYAEYTEQLLNASTDDWKLPFESMTACVGLWARGQQPPAYLLDQVSKELEQIGLSSEWLEYKDLQQLRLQMFAREPKDFSASEREFLETYFYSDPLGKGLSAYVLLNEFASFEPDPSVWYPTGQAVRSKKVLSNTESTEVAFAFPNPCENYTALRHESLEVYNASFCIRNITGIPVMRGELKKGTQTHVLDLDELQAGVYLVELTLDNQRGTKYQQKLIKQ